MNESTSRSIPATATRWIRRFIDARVRLDAVARAPGIRRLHLLRDALERLHARQEGLVLDDHESPDGEWQVS